MKVKPVLDFSAKGTKETPITLTAKDPINPPILRGPRIRDSNVLHLIGDYWIMRILN